MILIRQAEDASHDVQNSIEAQEHDEGEEEPTAGYSALPLAESDDDTDLNGGPYHDESESDEGSPYSESDPCGVGTRAREAASEAASADEPMSQHDKDQIKNVMCR